jgi:peroxiredoxin
VLLLPGQPAPDFDVLDIFEQPVRLRAYAGRRLLLSFYRFASCPFCNLRVHRLLQCHSELHSLGLQLVGVFRSRPELVRKHVGKQDAPFPIIADPAGGLYAAYGVASSKAGMVRSLLRMPDGALALAKGFAPRDIDTALDLMPADFLIDEEATIRVTYYGRDAGDHLPLDRVMSFAAAAGAPSNAGSPRVSG